MPLLAPAIVRSLFLEPLLPGRPRRLVGSAASNRFGQLARTASLCTLAGYRPGRLLPLLRRRLLFGECRALDLDRLRPGEILALGPGTAR